MEKRRLRGLWGLVEVEAVQLVFHLGSGARELGAGTLCCSPSFRMEQGDNLGESQASGLGEREMRLWCSVSGSKGTV